MSALLSVNNETDTPVLVSQDMAKYAGLQVYWRLAGHFDKDELLSALSFLDPRYQPRPVSLDNILKRSLEELSLDQLVRKFRADKGKKGFSMVEEQSNKLDIDSGNTEEAYKVKLTARVVEENGQVKLHISPPGHPQAQNIVDTFKKHRDLFAVGPDLSLWLSKTIMTEYLGGVSGRERGGFYYIARENITKFEQFAEAIKAVSVFDSSGKLLRGIKLYAIPMLMSSQLRESIVDTFMDDVSDLTTEIMEDLTQDERTLRANGYETRRNKVLAALDKLEMFKSIIDDKLPQFQEQLNNLQNAIGLAEANHFANLRGIKSSSSTTETYTTNGESFSV